MRRAQTLGWLAMAAAVVGCNSTPRLAVTLRFDERPTFERTPSLVFELRKGPRVLRREGPFDFELGSVIPFRDVPFGEGLTLVVELLPAPFFNASPTYRGESAPFDFKDGDSAVSVEVVLVPVTDRSTAAGPGPEPPVEDRVRLVRRPWGRSGEAAEFRVEGDAGAAPGGSTVLAYDGPDIAQSAEVGRVAAGEDGSFLLPLLSYRSAALYLAVAREGRASDADPGRPGLQAGPVVRQTWTAAWGNKVAGSLFANPHQLLRVPNFEPSLIQSSVSRSEVNSDEYDRLATGSVPVRSLPARPRWRSRTGNPVPEARWDGAATFDPVLGRVLVFGGRDLSQQFAGLWAWDGRTWSPTEGGPGPRFLHAMAFDERLGETVLFGGNDQTRPLGELWSFDGSRWLRREDPPAEAPAVHAAIAFDRTTHRLVVFGGSGRFLNEVQGRTWTFGADGWAEDTDGPQPDPRRTAGLAQIPDSQGGGLLLFGGSTSTGEPLADTWIFRDGSWSRVEGTGASPQGRDDMILVDTDEGVMLFGGEGRDETSFPQLLDDVWIFRDAAWHRVERSGEWPAGRDGAMGAFDRHRGEVVVFGGRNPAIVAETWAFAGGDWQLVAGEMGSGRRPAYTDAAGAFHAGLGQPVVHGGRDARSRVVDRVEAWDGERWVALDVDSSNGGPGPRYRHTAAHLAARDQLVVFGGIDPLGELPPDRTWLMKRDSERGLFWESAPTPDELVSVIDGTLVEAPTLGGQSLDGVLHFGGADPGRRLDDPWLFDGNGWRLLPVERPRPGPRANAALTYDPRDGGRLLLFGGEQGFLPNSIIALGLGDFWEFDGTQWREIRSGLGGSPLPRFDHQLTYDPVERRVILSGGCAAYVDDPFGGCFDPRGDLWAHSGGRWNRLADDSESGAPPRYGHIDVWDATRGVLLTRGGQDVHAQGVVAETFALLDGTWVDLTRAGGPAARIYAEMARDPSSGDLLLHGGCSGRLCAASLSDTWRLGRAGWRLVPEARSVPRAYVHGMATGPGNRVSAVSRKGRFEWSSAFGWSRVQTLSRDFEQAHVLSVPSRDEALVFGPLFSGTDIPDPPVLLSLGFAPDGAPAESVLAEGGPYTFNAAAAYDESRERVVVFGGQGLPEFGRHRDDLFEWSADEGWVQVERRDPWPSPRQAASLVYDPEARATILFGGDTDFAPSGLFNDAWLWDGENWTALEPDGTAPRIRSGAAATFDPRRGEVVVFGGGGERERVLDDTWGLESVGRIRSGFVATFDLSIAELDLARLSELSVRGQAEGTPGLQVLVWSTAESAWVPAFEGLGDVEFSVQLSEVATPRAFVTGAGRVHVAVIPPEGGLDAQTSLNRLELDVEVQ